MAKSTIPGAGLGIFTGVDREIGDVVGKGDVMFPIIDRVYHAQTLGAAVLEAAANGNNEDDDDDDDDGDDVDDEADGNNNNISHKHNSSFLKTSLLIDPTQNYIWFGPDMGMQQETSHAFVQTEYVSAFAPGLDAAINCHLALTNVEKRQPIYDTAGLHRSKDPGTGAFTPYHNCETYISHPIPAGAELFKYYGDEWFIERTEILGLIPLSDDYPAAEELIHRFHSKVEQHPLDDLPDKLKADLWENVILQFPWPSRTLNALPKHYNDLAFVVENDLRTYYQRSAMHTTEYLEQHGRCLDYIEARPSTIRQAGRGAFATQNLPQGTKLAGSPLLVFPNRQYFEMYQGNWMTKDDIPDKNHVVQHQILLNYCWNHATASSIYLCPYGAGINYINHAPNQTAVNAKLQWAAAANDGEMGHLDKWLHMHPRHMMSEASPGLFMDVVATRDILVGEEIFLDYGEAWQNAWEHHVAQWGTAYRYSENYTSARDWSNSNPNAVLRTEKEQKNDPYPSHFELRCLHDLDSYEYSHEEAIEQWNEYMTPGNPCRILDRKMEQSQDNGESIYYYKVVYKEMERHDVSEIELTTLDEQEWIESDWIVRGALRFVDAPYSTDLMLKGVFRHAMGLPDEMLPDAWRGVFLSYEDLLDKSN